MLQIERFIKFFVMKFSISAQAQKICPQIEMEGTKVLALNIQITHKMD